MAQNRNYRNQQTYDGAALAKKLLFLFLKRREHINHRFPSHKLGGLYIYLPMLSRVLVRPGALHISAVFSSMADFVCQHSREGVNLQIANNSLGQVYLSNTYVTFRTKGVHTKKNM